MKQEVKYKSEDRSEEVQNMINYILNAKKSNRQNLFDKDLSVNLFSGALVS